MSQSVIFRHVQTLPRGMFTRPQSINARDKHIDLSLFFCNHLAGKLSGMQIILYSYILKGNNFAHMDDVVLLCKHVHVLTPSLNHYTVCMGKCALQVYTLISYLCSTYKLLVLVRTTSMKRF